MLCCAMLPTASSKLAIQNGSAAALSGGAKSHLAQHNIAERSIVSPGATLLRCDAMLC